MKVTLYYACDSDGSKYVYSEKPEKGAVEWRFLGTIEPFAFKAKTKIYAHESFKWMLQQSIDFDSIPEPKWEDEEPIEIYIEINYLGYGII